MKPKFNPMVKHQKKILIACCYAACFHPATEMYIIGCHNRWFCDCHNPIAPKECNATKVAKENENHTRYGDCAFCKTTHSKNIMQGIDGKIAFVCECCYRTPMHELRRFWR